MLYNFQNSSGGHTLLSVQKWRTWIIAKDPIIKSCIIKSCFILVFRIWTLDRWILSDFHKRHWRIRRRTSSMQFWESWVHYNSVWTGKSNHKDHPVTPLKVTGVTMVRAPSTTSNYSIHMQIRITKQWAPPVKLVRKSIEFLQEKKFKKISTNNSPSFYK